VMYGNCDHLMKVMQPWPPLTCVLSHYYHLVLLISL